MQIGHVVASFRQKKKMDQKELAQALNISVTYLSLIENDRKRPSPTLIRSIARYFGVPVSTLLLMALQDTDFKSKDNSLILMKSLPLLEKIVDFLITEEKPAKNKKKKSK